MMEDMENQAPSAPVEPESTQGFAAPAEITIDLSEWLDMTKTEVFNVRICDPEAKTAGVGRNFVDYRILTSPHDWDIRRRYSDFEWLRDQLVMGFPAMIIPQLPAKKAVGNMNDDFIVLRMRGLKVFIDFVASNPFLKNASVFRDFLSLNDNVGEWTRRKKDKNAVCERVAEKMWLKSGSAYELPTNSENIVKSLLTQILAVEAGLNKHLGNTKKFVERSAWVANTADDVKESFATMGQTGIFTVPESLECLKTNSESMAALSKEACTAFDKVVRLLSFSPSEQRIFIEEPTFRMVGDIASIKHFIAYRNALLNVYQKAWKKRDGDELTLRKLNNAVKKNEKKITKMEAQVQQDHADVDDSKYLLDSVTKLFLFVELPRFWTEANEMMTDCLIKYAGLQIASAMKTIRVWDSFLGQCQMNKEDAMKLAKAHLIEESTPSHLVDDDKSEAKIANVPVGSPRRAASKMGEL
eukprot:TRINITY_DN25217_c0_g1_i2.p1 TRINITY_DN25217_c0_g1~~TRINITY_DN25217_c0_g1_i2.p1  ORF type:complete len:477 (+),score=179.50 TRINITY_DN25217_c0_g1_i2:27-1433(+)